MYNRLGVMKSGKTKHNFDKKLSHVSGNIAAASPIVPVNTLLYTSSFPCVVVGIVVNGTVTTVTAGEISIYMWFLMVVREGEVVPTPNFTIPANPAIAPEEHVMVFGVGAVSPGTLAPCECKTKTSRKLMSGDRLYFIIANGNLPPPATSITYAFTIQFFLRT